jgi:EpsD family peptidyl-prolyl cis-trans isomerase
MRPSTVLPRLQVLRHLLFVVLVAVAAMQMAACGEKKKGRVETQAAARVADEDITVQQINLVLQEQRNLRPDQADAAGRLVLERLIDQELAVQKASALKLDRDPRVVQLLDTARRQVLARAYAERIGEAAARPTPDDVKQYYAAKPALFGERRVYSIQELAIDARPDQMPELRQHLASAKSIGEFVEHLKAQNIRFAANQAVRAAEQLHPVALETLMRMKDGQASMLQGAAGVQVLVLAGSRLQPIGEEQARPMIEQQILAERKRKLVDEDLKALRAAGKVEYLGPFADGPRPTPAAAASDAAALPMPAAASDAPGPSGPMPVVDPAASTPR